MIASAGYSGTPLPRKLGFKDGQAVAFVAFDPALDVIRKHALNGGLVDVKVCAVDETWSGLKLVIPLADRKLRETAHG
jgi:hypothetical protein